MFSTAWILLTCLMTIGPDASLPGEDVLDVDEHARVSDASAGGASPAGVARPSYFVENRGQWPDHVRFLCETERTVVSVENHGIALQLLDPAGETLPAAGGVLVRIFFEGGDPEHGDRAIEGVDRLRGTFNVFLGNDPSLWLTNIATFAGVRYREILPGIDLVLRSLADGSLKYDLHVAPGADLSRLVVRCAGIEGLGWGRDGEVCLETALGPIAHARGASWEVLPDGGRRTVECRERLLSERSFGFEVGERDPTLALVIDPGIVWSTYLGSSGGIVGDGGRAVATGAAGDVTVVGKKDGPTFPATPGTFQSPGSSPQSPQAVTDVFVTRLSGVDGSLVYSSVIGGFSNQEEAVTVDVDSEGQATVAGRTDSGDFPTTPGAFDTTQDVINGASFVLRLSASGDRLLYSTFLEGVGGLVEVRSVRVDRSTGSALVCGAAVSGFPTTPGAWSENLNGIVDGFVTRLDPTGSALEWSTYFGGSSVDYVNGVTLDPQGNVTVTGETFSSDLPTTPGAFDRTLGIGSRNAFVARIDPTGSGLVWSTYLGGSGPFTQDIGLAITTSPAGDIFVTGTAGFNFPTTPGAFQAGGNVPGAFVTRFDQNGTLLYSTYVAGPGTEIIADIAVDGSGMTTIAGFGDPGFPMTPGSLSTVYHGGAWDSVVARLTPSLSNLVYSSFVGGSALDGAIGMSMSPTGRVALVGTTNGSYPTTPGSHSPTYNGGQTDAFVTTLDLYLQGVEPHGESTPACRGPLIANATEMPASGAHGFAFYCSGAPPLSTGRLILGRLRASPVRRAGVDVWINLALPVRIIPVTSDSDGYLEVPWPLGNAAPGAAFSAQFFFRTTAACPGSGAWCASDAVRVTVQ